MGVLYGDSVQRNATFDIVFAQRQREDMRGGGGRDPHGSEAHSGHPGGTSF